MTKTKLDRNGVCALCKKPKLLCKSHIVPEMFYTDIYDEKHFMNQMSIDPNVRTRKRPSGHYEYLLCRDCETVIGTYEDEAAKLRNDKAGTLKITNITDTLSLYEGFDYAKFKLFQLSIIWRMSISKEYDQVDLGPFNETIRLMLLEARAGEVGDFCCIMGLTTYEGKPATQFMFSPVRTKYRIPNTTRVAAQYIATFGGFTWWFIITTDYKLDRETKKLTLQKDGSLYVGIQDILKVEGLRGTIGKAIHKTNQQRAE